MDASSTPVAAPKASSQSKAERGHGQRQITAYHEAGHAVIAVILGYTVSPVYPA